MNFNLISWIHKNDSKEKILNYGFKTYRDKYLDPITTFTRLKSRYPRTSAKTIRDYVSECEKANKHGANWIQTTAAKETKLKALVRNKKFRLQFEEQMTEQFPWINKFNLSSIYNWTCYGLILDDTFEQ
jgi:PHP family Zn ribbon phosphoesterase